jgi:hypothetical protein
MTVTHSGHIETDWQLTTNAVTDVRHCPAIPGNRPNINNDAARQKKYCERSQPSNLLAVERYLRQPLIRICPYPTGLGLFFGGASQKKNRDTGIPKMPTWEAF